MNPNGPARLDDAFAKVSDGLRRPQKEALERLKNDLGQALDGDLKEDPREIAHKLEQNCGWQRPHPWLPEFDFALATGVGKTLLAQATIELLVRAGIPPLAVLKIATHDAADWLGVLDTVGTVETGKRADLVVIDGNPLDDIRNTRTISRVYLGGREIDREGLRGRWTGRN